MQLDGVDLGVMGETQITASRASQKSSTGAISSPPGARFLARTNVITMYIIMIILYLLVLGYAGQHSNTELQSGTTIRHLVSKLIFSHLVSVIQESHSKRI